MEQGDPGVKPWPWAGWWARLVSSIRNMDSEGLVGWLVSGAPGEHLESRSHQFMASSWAEQFGSTWPAELPGRTAPFKP